MIDHLLGRPSTGLKRLQVLLVLTFWGWVLGKGPRDGPQKVPFARRLNQYASRFSPWQIFVFSLTSVYAIRHLDALAGFGAPEPLARMYSRPFYRVTWIVTALDAGFATAMTIKPQWLRDLASMVFSTYYLIYANEAEEKLRKFRAFCTIDMMRATWHKTTNPYIRAVTWIHRPSLPIARPILLPRPEIGPHAKRPTRAWLFYVKEERSLQDEDELIIDFCGGGFVCMDPRHHEERLRQVAKETQKPVLAIDYCKAPEYPYPYALEECFDVYRSLQESGGRGVGMSGRSSFRTILTGDSAGGNLAAAVMLKILEYPQPGIKQAYAVRSAAIGSGIEIKPPTLRKPISMVLVYPSLNFAYTSWMKPEHLNVLRQQSEVNLQALQPKRGSPLKREVTPSAKGRSSGKALTSSKQTTAAKKSYTSLAGHAELHLLERARMAEAEPSSPDDGHSPRLGDGGSQRTNASASSSQPWLGRIEGDEVDEFPRPSDAERSAAAERDEQQRRLQATAEKMDMELEEKQKKANTVNTRLTMTSMAGYFQDRILTQSMMRAMAILYIGPRSQPDFDHDMYLSPIVAPARLLAEFPPVLFICGEKDPICDDTVVMAGRIRQAKLSKQADLKRRGARFGEQLRMSGAASNLEEMDNIDDWVQMRIIEGWSHGFMQMSSLLAEAKHVISFVATWMSDSFEDYYHSTYDMNSSKLVAPLAPTHQPQSHSNSLPAPSSLAKALAERQINRNRKASVGSANGSSKGAHDLEERNLTGTGENGTGEEEEQEEEDEEEPLSFTPKGRRSPSVQSVETAPNAVVVNLIKEQDRADLGASARLRPSSFSNAESSPRNQLLPPQSPPSRRRRSDEAGNPAAQTSLVHESKLLERRRQDALGYMTGGQANNFTESAVADSGSDDDEADT